MTFPIRSETASRIISAMRPEELKAPGAVDRLVELAESDGKLTAEERTALKGALLQFQQSGFDPVQRGRLEAYLGMQNATVRHVFAAGAQDGVIDIADAQKALKAMGADGRISGNERMTVRGAMLAFKMDAAAVSALDKGLAPETGPFKDIRFKDAGLANALRGFTGVAKLGVAQVDVLLKAAADGKGMTASEKAELVAFHKNHAALLDGPARVKLGAALGVSGLEGAPVGQTRIATWNADFTSQAKSLDFRKTADGKMEAMLTASHGSHGWMPVKPDGTFSNTIERENGYQDRSVYAASGKVSFENGAFTAEFRDMYRTDTTTPGQYNSGDRVPVSYGDDSVFKTENHPSNDGMRLFTNPGSPHLRGIRTAAGVSIQLAGSAPYNVRIPVGADGKIDHQVSSSHYTGQVSPDGTIQLACSNVLGPSYTETTSWDGKLPGLLGP